jgi:hypothetical protein
MITYGDLYNYLESKLIKQNPKTINNFHYTLEFCQANGIQTDRLFKILYDFGGHNDLQIILNVSVAIGDDTPISKEIETPVEFAIRNNYYARFHEGMWVRCKKNDNGSMPDLNTAYQKMFGDKNERES